MQDCFQVCNAGSRIAALFQGKGVSFAEIAGYCCGEKEERPVVGVSLYVYESV